MRQEGQEIDAVFGRITVFPSNDNTSLKPIAKHRIRSETTQSPEQPQVATTSRRARLSRRAVAKPLMSSEHEQALNEGTSHQPVVPTPSATRKTVASTTSNSSAQSDSDNFFGMNDDTKTSASLVGADDKLNYFDQQLMRSYVSSPVTPGKGRHTTVISSKPIKPSVSIKDAGSLSHVDEFFFGESNQELNTSNNNKNKRRSETKTSSSVHQDVLERHITKDDLAASLMANNEGEVNFADELLIKSQIGGREIGGEGGGRESVAAAAAVADQPYTGTETIGCVQDLSQLARQRIEQLGGNIPIIGAENVGELHELTTKFNFDPKKQVKSTQPSSNDLMPSEHKKISEEVFKWYTITMLEAVDILVKSVCYLNRELGLLAIDKPYGLPCMGGPGVTLCVSKLMPLLKDKLNLSTTPLMCHRLDECTSGVLLFALSVETAQRVRTYFNEHRIAKQYLAITRNVPSPPVGEIDIPLVRREVNGVYKTYLSPKYDEETTGLVLDRPKGENNSRKNAITRYRLIDQKNMAALVELQPLTGFQHQIRAHLSFGLNTPILGDHKYSYNIKVAPQKLPDQMLRALDIRQSKVRHVPMHLHNAKLILPEFENNGRNVFISAKLPLHFLNNMKRLGLKFK